jgi:hypothetical protein
MLIDQIASNAVLDEAFAWLCQRRRDYPANADIWSFRRNWSAEKTRIWKDLTAHGYRFDALSRVQLANGSPIDLWSSRDALVLKALSITLASVLPSSGRCIHIKGHGGAKAAIRAVAANLPDNDFVLRTDVKSYYASIDHHFLLNRLAEHVTDRAVMNLLAQYMRCSICDGGNYIDIERGISLGCPLSPLMAGFFLHELDTAFDHTGLFYVRFMDDVLILAPTRWKIRKAMARVQSILHALRLETHPEKTFIGRITRGFGFLGYHFLDDTLCAARSTHIKMQETATRLYEQKGREGNLTPLGQYLTRWNSWFRGGLDGLVLRGGFLPATEGSYAAQGRQQKHAARW